MTERQLQAAVVECAQLLGWLVYHTFDSRRSQPGFPDLVLARARDSRLIFAELKRTGGATRPAQQQWLQELSRISAGGDGTVCVTVWRPADWTSGRIERALR